MTGAPHEVKGLPFLGTREDVELRPRRTWRERLEDWADVATHGSMLVCVIACDWWERRKKRR